MHIAKIICKQAHAIVLESTLRADTRCKTCEVETVRDALLVIDFSFSRNTYTYSRYLIYYELELWNIEESCIGRQSSCFKLTPLKPSQRPIYDT